MKRGDLVKYGNSTKIPKNLIGIILNEESEIYSMSFRYFNVLFEDGRIRLKSYHYLELINEQ